MSDAAQWAEFWAVSVEFVVWWILAPYVVVMILLSLFYTVFGRDK